MSFSRFSIHDPWIHLPTLGEVVPQADYEPAQEGTLERAECHRFRNARGNAVGISLVDILAYPKLSERWIMGGSDSIILTTTAKYVKVHVWWPGTFHWDWKLRETRISYARAAVEVAEHLKENWATMQQTFLPMHPWEEEWHPSRISFSKLHLVELRRAGTGSWQPVFTIVR